MRKTLLMFAVFVFALALPAFATAQTSPIVGLWRTTVAPQGVPAFTAWNNFSADGNSSEFDNSLSPAQESFALGRWRHLEINRYAYTAYNDLFAGDGSFVGTFEVTARITLHENRYTSDFVYIVRTPGGSVVAKGTGTAHAVRVGIDSHALAQIP